MGAETEKENNEVALQTEIAAKLWYFTEMEYLHW